MTRDEVLQMAREAGEALEGEWQMGGLSNGLYMDYACEVALAVAHLVEQRTREECAEWKRDAERYQWYRWNPTWESECYLMDITPDKLDAAIDEAIRATSTLQASKAGGG